MQKHTIVVKTEMKGKFNATLFSHDSKYNSVLLTKQKYDSIVEDVKRIRTSQKKESSRDYRIIERYDVLNLQGCEKLIEPLSNAKENVKLFVHVDELFDILYSTHLSIGHGGRDKMIKELNKRYKNITQAQIKLFLNLCESCQQKQKSEKKGIVVKPIISPHFNSRCQVDLIDYQSQADKKFKFLLVYQDHLTKFVVLKPLSSKQADEVAYNLLDIFLLLGAPCILQSDNGREFCNRVLDSLRQMWPELKMVHGKPKHSQSQGSVERANQDIENMLTTWMTVNKTDHWSEGVRFVQFMKNRAYHSGIKRSPYEAMFGYPAKVGLTSSIIMQDVLDTLDNEDDLEKLKDSQEAALTKDIEFPSTSKEEIMEDAELPCTTENSSAGIQEVVTEYGIRSAFKDEPLQIQDASMIEASICIVCSKETSGEHICSQCNMFVHIICGETQSEEGFGKKLLCSICKNTIDQEKQRAEAKIDLKKQAKEMIAVSNVNRPIADEGITVRIKVPEVDRAKTDARSILAVVLNKTDNDFYKLGTRTGILKQLYSRSQFSVCKEKLLSKEDVPNVDISLRQTAVKQSLSSGQGYKKCDCKTKCTINRCTCRRNKLLCNSKCHQSLDCTNKKVI